MLYSAGVILAVAEAVRRYRLTNLVVDPVMISSSGKRLLKKDAEDALIGELFPLALVVMPNVAEAAKLAGMEIKSLKDAEEAAARIKKLGPKNVLIKGGHLLAARWRQAARAKPWTCCSTVKILFTLRAGASPRKSTARAASIRRR